MGPIKQMIVSQLELRVPFAVLGCELTGFVALQLVADVYNINPAPHYAIFNGLLLFLFGLHLYW